MESTSLCKLLLLLINVRNFIDVLCCCIFHAFIFGKAIFIFSSQLLFDSVPVLTNSIFERNFYASNLS